MYVQGKSHVWIDIGSGEPLGIAAVDVSFADQQRSVVKVTDENGIVYHAHPSRVIVQQQEGGGRHPSWGP